MYGEGRSVPGSRLDDCLPMVQCSPFQPCSHSHFPSLQVPCFTQSGLHTRWSHAAPVHPSSQRQEPPMHTPCVPQSTEQTSERENKHMLKNTLIQYFLYSSDSVKRVDWPTEQSGPIQLGSQLHRPVSGIKAPWPWHWSGHWALGSSQLGPPQPGLQWHSPFTQIPLLEQVGSKQSTVNKKSCLMDFFVTNINNKDTYLRT